LRERTAGYSLAGKVFLKEFAAENDKNVNDFTPEALEALMNYAWPGNVRELRTAIEHAVVLTRGEKIGLRDLPAACARGLRRRSGAHAGAAGLDGGPGGETIDPARSRNAPAIGPRRPKKLGMSRRTLHRKLHLYHLEGV
jgi:DNA-binding NtrC family response regulator